MIDVVDLHIHSHYSMATSKDMDLEHLSFWARKKGATILATGDITHPLWVQNLKSKLTDLHNGFFEYGGVRFVLAGEVNLVFEHDARMRKVHVIIVVPSFGILNEVNKKLSTYGNLSADGRPTLFVRGEEFVRVLKQISEDIKIVPAHVWTPWFGVFGSKSGFSRLEDCFGEQVKSISALETGLSSDPAMNYIVRNIDRFTLVSNSDAHSPQNIVREANVITDVSSYDDLFSVIENADEKRFLFTIEFFPEEGKYFGDGHRKCGIGFVPENPERKICPVCGKPFTYGVYHRVIECANWKREERENKKIPFRYVIPLKEILSVVLGKGKNTKTVSLSYDKLLSDFGTELNVLLFSDVNELKEKLDERIASFIIAMRNGNVHKEIGYDGKYGKIYFREKKIGLFDR